MLWDEEAFRQHDLYRLPPSLLSGFLMFLVGKRIHHARWEQTLEPYYQFLLSSLLGKFSRAKNALPIFTFEFAKYPGYP
jgi:hypothetical protein